MPRCVKMLEDMPRHLGMSQDFTEMSQVNYLISYVCSVYAQAILNFRMAVRRNNSALLLSAKHYSMGLFFGQNHPMYQKIAIFDFQQYIMMPAEVKALWDANVSISVSGQKSKGQGFDYALEEKNRDIKQFIPKHVTPTASLWLKVCRNNEMLINVNKAACNILQCTAPPDLTYKEIHTKNVVKKFRCCFCEKHYLSGDCLEHVSLAKKPQLLHPNLVNFEAISNKNRSKLISRCIMDNDVDACLVPAFITKDDGVEYNTGSLAKLVKSVGQLIKNVENEEYREELKDQFQMNKNSKNGLLEMFHEIEQRKQSDILPDTD